MTNTTQRAKPTAKRLTVAVLSLGGVALIAACGYSSTNNSGMQSSSAPAAPGTPASGGGSAATIPCAEITALRTSLTNLTHTPVTPLSAGKLATELGQIEQEVATLKSQSNGAFTSMANPISTGLQQIQAEAEALAKDPSATNLTNLTNAVTSFKTTSQPLIKEMQSFCP